MTFIGKAGYLLVRPRMACQFFIKKMFNFVSRKSLQRDWIIYGDSRPLSIYDSNSRLSGIEDVTILNPLVRTANTSVTPDELVAICSLVKAVNATKVLEIGTFDGNTTLNIAANLPEDATITTIDLPIDNPGEFEIDIPEKYKNMTKRSMVGAQFEHSPLKQRITQVYSDTGSLDWSTLNPPFDVIFIDGCHDYEYVISDTANAISCLSDNGVIIWHDYASMIDVSKAVDEFSDQLDIVSILDTRLAIGSKASSKLKLFESPPQ